MSTLGIILVACIILALAGVVPWIVPLAILGAVVIAGIIEVVF